MRGEVWIPASLRQRDWWRSKGINILAEDE